MHPDSPLQDVRVRQGVQQGHKPRRVERGTLRPTRASPCTSTPSTPSLEGWTQSWVDRFPEAYGYDPVAARALLAEAGYNENNPLETNVHVFKLAQLPGADDVAEVFGRVHPGRRRQGQLRAGRLPRLSPNTKLRTQQYGKRPDRWPPPAPARIVGASVYGANTSFSRAPRRRRKLDAKITGAPPPRLTMPAAHSSGPSLATSTTTATYNIPLFWLPAEVIVNPEVVSGFTWPGALSGFWSHMWELKSA